MSKKTELPFLTYITPYLGTQDNKTMFPTEFYVHEVNLYVMIWGINRPGKREKFTQSKFIFFLQKHILTFTKEIVGKMKKFKSIF